MPCQFRVFSLSQSLDCQNKPPAHQTVSVMEFGGNCMLLLLRRALTIAHAHARAHVYNAHDCLTSKFICPTLAESTLVK